MKILLCKISTFYGGRHELAEPLRSYLTLTDLSRKIERPLTVGLTHVSGSAKILLVESGMQLKEFEISITHGGQNPSSTDKDWNPLP